MIRYHEGNPINLKHIIDMHLTLNNLTNKFEIEDLDQFVQDITNHLDPHNKNTSLEFQQTLIAFNNKIILIEQIITGMRQNYDWMCNRFNGWESNMGSQIRTLQNTIEGKQDKPKPTKVSPKKKMAAKRNKK